MGQKNSFFYVYIVVIIIIVITYSLLNIDDVEYINFKDNYYYSKFIDNNLIRKLLNNNLLDKEVNKKNKILIITYDNRHDQEYIKIHNNNIKLYIQKWNYEYKFYNTCNKNNYWCKIHMVLDALKTNEYDYVMWLDSDTVIKNFDIDIGKILNKFSSDIFIGSDNNPKFYLTNAGVFIIKNTKIGINFLNHCINYIPTACFKKDGSLHGSWAGVCYEQGIMNLLIADKYYNYTTILSNEVIFNYNVCSNEVFIMHLYASSPDYRKKCFINGNFYY